VSKKPFLQLVYASCKRLQKCFPGNKKGISRENRTELIAGERPISSSGQQATARIRMNEEEALLCTIYI
jgi:hypothetical protein